MTLNAADPDFISALAEQLPTDTLRAPEPRYLQEQRGKYQGRAGAVARPRSTEDVATIVKACAQTRVAVVPYGGGTGLVGGQIAIEGPLPLVISLERMNAIRGIFPAENVITVEAGAILQDIQMAAGQADRLFPLSLAAQGSCQIGGNLSTNAGGLNVLRYGNARDLCLGMEAVLPNGEVWNGLTRLRKDNTGYDLKNLLIGAEGSLGIITAASLKLFARPQAEGTAILVVPSASAALDVLAMLRAQIGEAVSAFELLHHQGLSFLQETMPDVRLPFSTIPEWAVLVDVGLGLGQDPHDALETLFVSASEKGLVSDGVIAQSETQRAELWAIRESIPLANKKIGSVVSHDISVPISSIPEFIEEGAQEIAKLGPFRINSFGHLGDGNLHYNVFPPKGRSRDEFAEIAPNVKATVHDLVARYQGSFSAEHGVGRMKTGDMRRYGDPTKLATMKAIKSAMDPNGIMNPGAMIDW